MYVQCVRVNMCPFFLVEQLLWTVTNGTNVLVKCVAAAADVDSLCWCRWWPARRCPTLLQRTLNYRLTTTPPSLSYVSDSQLVCGHRTVNDELCCRSQFLVHGQVVKCHDDMPTISLCNNKIFAFIFLPSLFHPISRRSSHSHQSNRHNPLLSTTAAEQHVMLIN